MSLRQYWQGVRHRLNQIIFQEFPAEGRETAEQYAKAAYACCVAWFGQPLDPHEPYIIQQAVQGRSFCMPMFGKYYLAISKEAVAPEHLCCDIAHEMYHRVTTGRKGIAGEMWVQEMMACLTSHWFLRKQGFQEYAQARKKHYLDTMEKSDTNAMRACRRQDKRRWLLWGGSIYPDGFSDSAIRTGYALMHILDGSDLCRIVKTTTLEEWIASLPPDRQYGVCRVLEVPPSDKKVPEDKIGLAKLFTALDIKGDPEVVTTEFQQIVRLQPENGNAFYYLGYAYKKAKQYDAALDAYRKALALNFTDRWLPFSIGSIYWHQKDFASAAYWYQEAIHCDSEWGTAYYFLGRSLNQIGDPAGANAAWEKVLTLGDKQYAEFAQ